MASLSAAVVPVCPLYRQARPS